MDSDQLGKDIQSILARLERLEVAMAARPLRPSRECPEWSELIQPLVGTGAMVGILLAPQPQQRPKEYSKELSGALPLTADWVGERGTGTRRSPDGQQEFRFMAFTQNNTNPFNDRPGVWRYFWSMVDRAERENYCATHDGGGVPPPEGTAFYFGCYNVTTGYGNWAHFFTGLRYSSGACCASRLTWNDGTSPPDADGWRRFYFPFDPYRVTVRCADNDRLGAGFEFLGVS